MVLAQDLSGFDDIGTSAGDVAKEEAHGFFWEDDVHEIAAQCAAYRTAVQGIGPQAQEALNKFLEWQEVKRQVVAHMAEVCLLFRP